jgi:large subunit ribosomal protein L7Ae
MTEDVTQKVLEAIEVAKNTGKVKKGTNEVTKALERGTAKLVAFAKDVQPQEIIVHLPVLAKEKGIPCAEISSKEELGAASGIGVPTGAVAIIAEGDAKKLIEELKSTLG